MTTKLNIFEISKDMMEIFKKYSYFVSFALKPADSSQLCRSRVTRPHFPFPFLTNQSRGPFY